VLLILVVIKGKFVGDKGSIADKGSMLVLRVGLVIRLGCPSTMAVPANRRFQVRVGKAYALIFTQPAIIVMLRSYHHENTRSH
jgi:hypothetical protein